MSYLWREVPNDKYWRIQTTDPIVKRKLNRRNTATLVGECFNHPMVIYRLQYYSPQKAKKSFQRMTGQKIKKDSEDGVFYAETYPILTNKNISEVSE
ncbi:MAG: hypothetical protein ACKVH5_08895 [Fidelibacterota bacterium]